MKATNGTWAATAGYQLRLHTEGFLMITVAIPFILCFLHEEFDSARSHWAALVFVGGTVLAKAWSISGVVCRCCRVPVYAYYFVGFPKERGSRRFADLARCPYCGDDGDGKTGTASRVDPRAEARRVASYVLKWMLVLGGILAVFLLIALLGWIPGYPRVF